MEQTTEEKKYTIEELREEGERIWVKCNNKEESNKLWTYSFIGSNYFPCYVSMTKYGYDHWVPNIMGVNPTLSGEEHIKKEYPYAQIINFNQIIFKENMQMKEKQKPQTFAIIGKPHQLISMEEDLKEIGYINWDNYKTTYEIDSWDRIGLCCNTLSWENKNIELTRISGDTEDKRFNLPEQYSEALQFCKEQLKIAEEYFKEKIPEYVECVKEDVDIKKGKIYKVHKQTCWNENYVYYLEKKFNPYYIAYFKPSTKEAYEVQNRLTFGGNEVTIEKKDNKTIFITCNRITGTYQELLNIYKYIKYCGENNIYLNFGGKKIVDFSILNTRVTEDTMRTPFVKIGCTEGTYEELGKIINECKNLIEQN
jgi:hypothetical protein